MSDRNWRIAPPEVDESLITGTVDADIAVVGLGYAGSAAFRAAAEAGAKVVAIEAMEEDRFSVLGEQVGHLNSQYLAEKGVPKVDPIDFYNNWMVNCSNKANPGLIMKFANKAGEAFDWYTTGAVGREAMENTRLMFWPKAPNFDGTDGAYRFWVGTVEFRNGRWPGYPNLTDVAKANHAKAKLAGGTALYGVHGERLITDGTGAVRGVIACRKKTGEYIRINAAKAVILAAGDFSRDQEMCEDLLPDMRGLMDEGEKFFGAGRDGSGIRMGVWAGGRLEAGPIATMGGNYHSLQGLIGSYGSLWLNCRCRRYCNEMFGDPVLTGFPGAEEERGSFYNVFDSGIIGDLAAALPTHTGFRYNQEEERRAVLDVMAQVDAAGKDGVNYRAVQVFSGKSWEELADNMALNDECRVNFLAAVKRYNEVCKNRRDEDFGKDPKFLRPLDKPPFYAERYGKSKIGRLMVSCGGLLTDADQNVLDKDRRPIPGLYATGNCCGRRFGAQYFTPSAGVSLGIAITLGREAGLTAAAL